MGTLEFRVPSPDVSGRLDATGARAGMPDPGAAESRRPLGGVGFDWAMSVLSGVFLSGLFLDGWAHAHGRVDESFFTPWHAVFYAGFATVAAFLGVALIRNHGKGYAWRRALPGGYGLSLVGVLVFAAGGVGDMVWHELFGVEEDVEALLSPTHLTLALGLALIVSGPARAAWQRGAARSGWLARVPALLSLTFVLCLFTFFTMYAHPALLMPGAASHHGTAGAARGVTSILFQAGLLAGVVLLAVRLGMLGPGSLTLIFTLNATAMGFLHMHDGYRLLPVVAAGAAGVVADLMLYGLEPSAQRPGALRVFALAVPAVFYFAYFLALIVTGRLAWSIHLWTGAVVLAGTVGWLLTYLLVPPRSWRAQTGFRDIPMEDWDGDGIDGS